MGPQLLRVCLAQSVASLTTQMSPPFLSLLLLEQWGATTSTLAALLSVANVANVVSLLSAPLWMGRVDARAQLLAAAMARVVSGALVVVGVATSHPLVLVLAQAANGASAVSQLSAFDWIVGCGELAPGGRSGAVARMQILFVAGVSVGPLVSVALMQVAPRAELMGAARFVLNAVAAWHLRDVEPVRTASRACERPPRDSVDLFLIVACVCGATLTWETVLNAILREAYGLAVDATFPFWTTLSAAAVAGALLAPASVGVLARHRRAWCMAAVGAIGWGMLFDVSTGHAPPTRVQFGVSLFCNNSMLLMLYSLVLMETARRYAPHVAQQVNWLLQVVCQLGRASGGLTLARLLDETTPVATLATSAAIGVTAHVVHVASTHEPSVRVLV